MKEFKDKVLVVTGAGNGLGAAVAKEGAKRGMKLVLNDIQEDCVARTLSECKAMGAQGVAQAADASKLENVQALYDLTMATYGQVDMVFNNAGIAISTPIWEVPLQDINWITEINFLSHVYVMRIFLPTMIGQGSPSAMINVASAAGIMVSGGAAMYHATKSADVAVSESTHIGLKDRGHNHVQMHVFCPAYIQTELHNSENARPERYADKSDPYYTGQEYLSSQRRTVRNILGGMPIDFIGEAIFTAVEDNKFYIMTHPASVDYSAAHRIGNLMNFRNPTNM